jgi:hypothetical protein
LAIDDVADRFGSRMGQHAGEPDAEQTNLTRLIDYFGSEKSLTDLDDAAVPRTSAAR